MITWNKIVNYGDHFVSCGYPWNPHSVWRPERLQPQILAVLQWPRFPQMSAVAHRFLQWLADLCVVPWNLNYTEKLENAQPYQLLTAISGHKDLTSRRAIIVEVRLPLWNGRHFPNPFPISESSWFQAVLTRYWRDCQIISVVSGCQCDQTETTENGLLWVWALVEAT